MREEDPEEKNEQYANAHKIHS